MNINEHPIYRNIYDLCQEIEKFPASEQATKVVMQASALEKPAAALLAENKMLADALVKTAGYLASVRTDRKQEHDGELYALQTIGWAEGALEYAEAANVALVAYDATRSNDQELSHGDKKI